MKKNRSINCFNAVGYIRKKLNWIHILYQVPSKVKWTKDINLKIEDNEIIGENMEILVITLKWKKPNILFKMQKPLEKDRDIKPH